MSASTIGRGVARPMVSVVIPTHNRRGFLATTIRSVLWQRDVEFEAIVVDDGSTDGSAQMLAGIGDRRVRIVRNEPAKGVSAARNRGLDEARGEWVAFLDDDDVWAPDKLVRQLTAAAEAGATWAYAGTVKIDSASRIVGGTPPPPPRAVMNRLPRWSIVPGGCSGVIAARAAVVSVGGFDDRFVNLADWDLWSRLASTGAPGCAGRPLVGYRLHIQQASLDVDLILREAALLETKIGTTLDRGALQHYLAHKCLLAGNRGRAVEHFLRAAAAGEVQSVTASVWSLVRERIGSGSTPRSRRSDHGAAWRSEAASWLAGLGRAADPAR
jgi:hypothetical protein